jgi:NAD(P)-dependent dehydrogenase (short-subunit alcohol dehydrogenase family)
LLSVGLRWFDQPLHSLGLGAGQVAIVTGAAQGIGEATVRLFAQHGAAVVVSDLDQGLLQHTHTHTHTHTKLLLEGSVGFDTWHLACWLCM